MPRKATTKGNPKTEGKSKKTANVTEAEKKLICPECGAGPYQDKRGWATHRFNVHKIHGTSASTIAYHRKQDRARLAGLAGKDVAPAAPERKPRASAPARAAASDGTAAYDVPASLVGYTAAKFELALHAIAIEHSLPKQQFVQAVAFYLSAISREQKSSEEQN
jgi:hypothetical protein